MLSDLLTLYRSLFFQKDIRGLIMNRVVVGLGSNINPEKNIKLAIKEIDCHHIIISESEIIETEPVGFLDQDNFLNGALLVETKFGMDKLKLWLKEVENKLGRIRTTNKNGPRTIDLDIVVWNGEVIDDDIYKRDFLKESVLEVLPELNLS